MIVLKYKEKILIKILLLVLIMNSYSCVSVQHKWEYLLTKQDTKTTNNISIRVITEMTTVERQVSESKDKSVRSFPFLLVLYFTSHSENYGKEIIIKNISIKHDKVNATINTKPIKVKLSNWDNQNRDSYISKSGHNYTSIRKWSDKNIVDAIYISDYIQEIKYKKNSKLELILDIIDIDNTNKKILFNYEVNEGEVNDFYFSPLYWMSI